MAMRIHPARQHQQATGVRFGEAAVALGLVSKDDILFALAQQFNYPYAAADAPKLGSDLVALNEPFSPRAESFRALRSQLMMRVFAEGRSSTALAVISPDAGDGKTYTASNLAVALAQLGGRTLLPVVGARLGVDAEHGAAFLASYGDEVGSMWKRFGAAVNEWCAPPDRGARALASAIATFEALHGWL